MLKKCFVCGNETTRVIDAGWENPNFCFSDDCLKKLYTKVYGDTVPLVTVDRNDFIKEDMSEYIEEINEKSFSNAVEYGSKMFFEGHADTFTTILEEIHLYIERKFIDNYTGDLSKLQGTLVYEDNETYLKQKLTENNL